MIRWHCLPPNCALGARYVHKCMPPKNANRHSGSAAHPVITAEEVNQRHFLVETTNKLIWNGYHGGLAIEPANHVRHRSILTDYLEGTSLKFRFVWSLPDLHSQQRFYVGLPVGRSRPQMDSLLGIKPRESSWTMVNHHWLSGCMIMVPIVPTGMNHTWRGGLTIINHSGP